MIQILKRVMKKNIYFKNAYLYLNKSRFLRSVVAKGILFLKKALFFIKTKQLKNKVLRQKMDKTLKEVCLSILDKDFERAIAIFSIKCLSQDISRSEQQFLNFFFNHPKTLQILRGSKTRYYEFFLGMVDPAKRTNLSRQLYDDKENNIQYIRETIALSNISELAKKGLFRDRLYEWTLIFKRKIPYLPKTLLQEKLEEQGVNNDTKLFKTLIKLSPLYFFRTMECPDLWMLQLVLEVIQFLEKKNTPLKILEYGCGSADPSILLLKRGHKPTICDIEGGNLSAAQKRFELRLLEVRSIGANQKCPVPFINEKFDLIIATEVLEHIRNPLKLLELIYELLDKDGIVIFGSFPFNKTNARGDHLEEAVSKRSQLLSWIDTHFTRIFDKSVRNVFKK